MDQINKDIQELYDNFPNNYEECKRVYLALGDISKCKKILELYNNLPDVGTKPDIHTFLNVINNFDNYTPVKQFSELQNMYINNSKKNTY